MDAGIIARACYLATRQSPKRTTAIGKKLRGFRDEERNGPHDAGSLDAAGIYPVTWQAWEDFEPLAEGTV